MTKTSLYLNGLHLAVYLGVYPEEIDKKQIVITDIACHFASAPRACFSDQLIDTYCYDKLIGHLKDAVATQKFQLLEHLTQKLHAVLKAYFAKTVRLTIRVTKQPPIADLTQGVTFEYGD